MDDDLAWRKLEISELYTTTLTHDTVVLRKSLLLIIYSHWEGFIKNASKLYLFHIENEKVKLINLTSNYRAISLKGLIGECFKSENGLTLNKELDFISTYSKKENQTFRLSKNMLKETDKSIINTKDNLNPEIFFNICKIIGIPEKGSILTREKWINDYLLNNRNSISHGSKLELPDSSEFKLSVKSLEELKGIILDILDNFKEDLSEYAEKQLYLHSNIDYKNNYDLESDKELGKRIKSKDDD